eukprot:9050292-Alexandrium_andersonii.AAC.1
MDAKTPVCLHRCAVLRHIGQGHIRARSGPRRTTSKSCPGSHTVATSGPGSLDHPWHAGLLGHWGRSGRLGHPAAI